MSALRRINPSIPIVAALMAVTAVLRLVNTAGSPVRLDDEGTYVAQAFAMVQWGELAHYTYWYDHPPAGWLQLAAWMTLTGPEFGDNAVVAGRYLMVGVAVLCAGLLWTLARRIGYTRGAAAAAVAVWAISPLAVALSRSVYLDNLAIAWLLAGLVLVCSPRQRLSAVVGAALCFGIAVLTKETMLLFAPMVGWLVWITTSKVTRRYALAVFGAVFGLVVSAYILIAAVRGELVPGPGHVSLWDGVKFQLWQREGSGSITDPASLKRHTIDEWLRLDPVLPLLAAPIALCSLLIARLRPYALGLLLLVVMVLRPGYLPVPFVIAALPFIALLGAGVGEEAVRRLRGAQIGYPRRGRSFAAAAAVFACAAVTALWLPSHDTVLTTDEDAPMRQAQQWITTNVPLQDRLIVDDAMWVDLVREGRDRHDVVWSYKVDTDEQVQSLAPDGWSDYGWVVSTPSMRANMSEQGLLTDAMANSHTVATFGTGGRRVDVMRVGTGDPQRGVPGAAPEMGVQVAARVDAASDADALATLQTGNVDQRVVATLGLLAATQHPVVLERISSVDGHEEIAGTPRREFEVAGSPETLSRLAALVDRQQRPFDAESVVLDHRSMTVRFAAGTGDVGLSTDLPPTPNGPPASVRIADVRGPHHPDRLEFVRVDGTPAGSLRPEAGTPTAYRSMTAGTYVMTTVADRTGVPMMRQAFTVAPGQRYTLALFSAGPGGEVAAQLAPDAPTTPAGIRLLHAAPAAGAVKLALSEPDGNSTTLADNASYGLVTGYGTHAAGGYDAVVAAAGHESRQRVELTDGVPTTLLLTDGPEGPQVHQIRDDGPAVGPLEPPALPPSTAAPEPPEKEHAKAARPDVLRERLVPVGMCAALIAAMAFGAVKYLRRQSR